MEYPQPVYVILVIVLIFIFLWFFCGGGEYEFIGLKPLYPDYVAEYSLTDYPSQTPNVLLKPIKSPIKPIEISIAPIVLPDDNDGKICVDITPTLPEEFAQQHVCLGSPNTNKFLSKGEKICRDTMEKIYGVPFTNQRPVWLKNDQSGRSMELDCYNEKLKLAIEYNGEQHYKWPNYFKNQTYDLFKEQVRRDELKKKLCDLEGVYLIVVPYIISPNLIPTYITYHLPEIVKKRDHPNKDNNDSSETTI